MKFGGAALRWRPPEGFIRRFRWLAVGLVWFFVSNVLARADGLLDTRNPTAFFTNVASRLLKSELNLDLCHIEIYPRNEYTPAVQRLLQVTANLYDATTNRADLTGYPYLPTVFRPVFTNDNGTVFIRGYAEVTNTAFLEHRTWDLSDPAQVAQLASLQPDDSIYNVPCIIGAKKGFPNFNEFSSETMMRVIRRLQFHKVEGTYSQIDQTNQTYIICVSNLFGVELWNSYSNAFPRTLDLSVGASVTVTLSNNLNQVLASKTVSASAVQSIPANTWSNFDQNRPNFSFRVPIMTDAPIATWFTNQYYSQRDGFPILQWWLHTHAHVRYALVDHDTGRIVDYVALSANKGPGNVTSALMSGGSCLQVTAVQPGKSGDLWCTNRIIGSHSATIPTIGIMNQILIGVGPPIGPDLSAVNWFFMELDPAYGNNVVSASDHFYFNFFGFNKAGDPSRYVPTNYFSSPFNPVRTIYQAITLQANDPLVHYSIPELSDLTYTNDLFADIDPNTPTNSLGRLNRRYNPWWGNPIYGSHDQNARNIALKDPLIWRSDAWNFPSGEPLDVAMLGRIHRGTPWQTLYLKSAAVNPVDWIYWTGDANWISAQETQPTNDWRLVRQLVSLLDTNDPRRLFSVNNPATNDWRGVLGGLSAITNSSPQSTTLMTSNSPQAAIIASAIQRVRRDQNGGRFQNVGDLLTTPELSLASPWLDTNQFVSDAAYERIPIQLLPRLREDSVGSVVVTDNRPEIRFAGYDDYTYAIEVSSNLADWISVGTNSPSHGVFTFLPQSSPAGTRQFYRTVLLPQTH